MLFTHVINEQNNVNNKTLVILSYLQVRMVNNGTLERVKRGLYMINKQNPAVRQKMHPIDPGQLPLFELSETTVTSIQNRNLYI